MDSIRYFKPLAFVMENAPGLLNIQGGMLLDRVVRELEASNGGYNVHFEVLNAADFGVPQVRLRVLFVAIQKELVESFSWPMPHFQLPQTVGDCLFDLMVARGWNDAKAWRAKASEIAPTNFSRSPACG